MQAASEEGQEQCQTHSWGFLWVSEKARSCDEEAMIQTRKMIREKVRSAGGKFEQRWSGTTISKVWVKKRMRPYALLMHWTRFEDVMSNIEEAVQLVGINSRPVVACVVLPEFADRHPTAARFLESKNLLVVRKLTETLVDDLLADFHLKLNDDHIQDHVRAHLQQRSGEQSMLNDTIATRQPLLGLNSYTATATSYDQAPWSLAFGATRQPLLDCTGYTATATKSEASWTSDTASSDHTEHLAGSEPTVRRVKLGSNKIIAGT